VKKLDSILAKPVVGDIVLTMWLVSSATIAVVGAGLTLWLLWQAVRMILCGQVRIC
jgi:hypothetical protein